MSHSVVRRIVLIGIDGATWDVIDPMIQQGRLPNFKKLLTQGVRADLKSLKLTTSPRVWTSIASGKSEEKHGIFNFRNNISDLKAKRIWDIFSEKGLRNNIFYWYLTWPPQKNINGFMVPGFLARDNQTIPKDLSFLKNIELSEKMRVQEAARTTGFLYYLKNGYRAVVNGVKISTMLKAFTYVIGRRFGRYKELDAFNKIQLLKLHLYGDVFTYMVKKHFTDFSAIMFPQPDQLGHKFWAFKEPDAYEKRTGEHIKDIDRKRYGDVIDNCYEEIDKIIGNVNKSLTENDVLIVLSDHGFGLVQKSYASLKIKGKKFLEILGLDKVANCMSVGINFIIKIEKKNNELKLDEISKKIEAVKTVEKDEKLFKVTFDENEIVLELRNIFSMYLDDAKEFLNRNIKIGDQIVPAKEILVNRSDITGEHRETGILFMKGKNLKKGYQLEKASVLDIVPTILKIKNFPVAKDMDGRVLTDAFDDSFIEKNPIETIETYESDNVKYYDENTDFSMTDELESRLKDLGYLD